MKKNWWLIGVLVSVGFLILISAFIISVITEKEVDVFLSPLNTQPCETGCCGCGNDPFTGEECQYCTDNLNLASASRVGGKGGPGSIAKIRLRSYEATLLDCDSCALDCSIVQQFPVDGSWFEIPSDSENCGRWEDEAGNWIQKPCGSANPEAEWDYNIVEPAAFTPGVTFEGGDCITCINDPGVEVESHCYSNKKTENCGNTQAILVNIQVISKQLSICLETCGDGVCDPGEYWENCPQDCEPVADCGNGICESGEDMTNCPEDCEIFIAR